MYRQMIGAFVSAGRRARTLGRPEPGGSGPHRGSILVLGAAATCLVVGGFLWLTGIRAGAGIAWAAATAAGLIPLTVGVVRDLLRRRVGVDVIALLAMAGALALHEYLAGAVIAIMLSGGQVLEWWASERARRELTALLGRTPRVAHRLGPAGLVTIDVSAVAKGETLLVKQGESVPVDGELEEPALLDESVLTGEAMPVERPAGETARSGTVNAGGTFRLRAAASADESTYAAIVRLTRMAAASRSPLVRLADRFAIFFLPATIVIAGSAWAYSGDPVRALAVLVVATPCPLILAAPVAVVAGMALAAGRGIVVKSGAALEGLARARAVIFDKTGTLTEGVPRLTRVATFGSRSGSEVLRLAASLDQASAHTLASALVKTAQTQGILLSMPRDVIEEAGAGIRGIVEGHLIALGKARWVATGPLPPAANRLRSRSAVDGTMTVFMSVDGALVGALLFEDLVREETPRAIRRLRDVGVRRVLILTGDRTAVGQQVGMAIGADGVLADRAPAEKLAAVKAEAGGGITVMVGDGINDAPALAAADVGVAMGSRGATAASETADVVVTVDRLDRVAEAVEISHRTRRIAMESIVAGMGLSLVAMGVAAAGHLPPVEGAVLQEVIDVLVILNALRALRRPAPHPAGKAGHPGSLGAEHRRLRAGLEEMLELADGLGGIDPGEARTRLGATREFLVSAVVPHERQDDAYLLPAVERVIGGQKPTEVMARAHAEIQALVHNFCQLVDDLPTNGPTDDDLPILRRALYGLHAILMLHLAQEDQSYLPLLDMPEPGRGG